MVQISDVIFSFKNQVSRNGKPANPHLQRLA